MICPNPERTGNKLHRFEVLFGYVSLEEKITYEDGRVVIGYTRRVHNRDGTIVKEEHKVSGRSNPISVKDALRCGVKFAYLP